MLVAITGRLREPGGASALLGRLGAVSRLKGVRYWSVTDQAWQTLIHEAFAVTDASGTNKREDFTPEELRPGVSLCSAERDGRSSGIVIYRMRVIERTPDRIVVSVVNASPVRTLLVTLFAPGELQTTYFLDRLGSDEWEFRQTNGSRRSVRFTPLSCIFEQAISNARSPCAVPPTIAGGSPGSDTATASRKPYRMTMFGC